MNCTNHENVEASGMCTYCGKPFCKDCLVEVKGKMYCKMKRKVKMPQLLCRKSILQTQAQM